jgi:hypothetical protein
MDISRISPKVGNCIVCSMYMMFLLLTVFMFGVLGRGYTLLFLISVPTLRPPNNLNYSAMYIVKARMRDISNQNNFPLYKYEKPPKRIG